MALLDFTSATQSTDMSADNLIAFGTFLSSSPTSWSWRSPLNHELALSGAGLVFGPGGHATAGNIASVGIDLGNNSATAFDIAISGFSASAPLLDDNAASFWRILDGNDIIRGPLLASAGAATFTIFGDSKGTRPGFTAGGNDTIDAGDAEVTLYGDVLYVGSQSPGAPQVDFTGGADVIDGRVTAAKRAIYGDADTVSAFGRLTGGNDTIRVASTGIDTLVYGDAYLVAGVSGNLAEFVGGNDTIIAATTFIPGYGSSLLVGDLAQQDPNSDVQGGNDLIRGGEGSDTIVGDIYLQEFPYNNGTLVTVCGDDTLSGGGEGDTIIGDIYHWIGPTFTGGDDVINGGDGNDNLFGDVYNTFRPTFDVGGNDVLNGDAGTDFLRGQYGNDTLNGGTGADDALGGPGNDRIDGGADADTLAGDDGNDVITGGDGDDRALGGENDDLMYGQAGRDRLQGGLGVDTIYGGDEVGPGDTLLAGDGGNDHVQGGLGSDRIDGGTENDKLYGEGGDDLVTGGIGNDRIEGGADVDTLYGEADNDYILGGSGIDTLYGGTGIDYLYGDADNDYLVGDGGNDNLYGGLGLDRFNFDLANGSDAIFDFTNDQDTLIIDPLFGFATAAAVVAATIQTGNHARILLPGADTDIYLWNYLAAGSGNTIGNLIDDITIA